MLLKEMLRASIGRHLANISEEERERRREHGRQVARFNLHAPEIKARSNSPEAKRLAGIKRRTPFSPGARQSGAIDIAKLKNRGRRAAVARQIITLAEIAAAEAARLEAMTPFEHQLERVRNGVRLIELPRRRIAEYAYTLGGVTGEIIV